MSIIIHLNAEIGKHIRMHLFKKKSNPKYNSEFMHVTSFSMKPFLYLLGLSLANVIKSSKTDSAFQK